MDSVPTNDDRPPGDGQGGTPARRRVRAARAVPEPSAEDWERLAWPIARLLAGSWDREQADLEAARRASTEPVRQGEREHKAEPAALTPPARRQRRRSPSPSRLAKWEAHWQADGEGES